jgi:hypothetical protein
MSISMDAALLELVNGDVKDIDQLLAYVKCCNAKRETVNRTELSTSYSSERPR